MTDLQILPGQHVLILGGTGSMGGAIASLAYRHGAYVTIAGRNGPSVKRAAEAIGQSVESLAADVSDESGVLALKSSNGKPFDHVVVATSANARASSIANTGLQDAQQAFSRYWTSYLVLHHAKRFVRPTGSIVLLSGSSGRRPAVGYGVWSALHGSIEALVKPAALELAPMRVNAVSPGGIGIPPDRNLVRHAGRPEDLALAVLLVMANPAMTGTLIDVDGGERLGTWSGEDARGA